MTPTATAFMLHGFLGAGKTTFARRLEEERGALRFSHDEWMARLYGHDPRAEDFRVCARRVSDLIEQMWTRALDLRVNVILDFGFWSRAERDRVRNLIAAHGGHGVLYRLSCPMDVAWKRIENRNRRLAGSLHIAPNTFETLKARFEPLGADEERIEIGGDDGA